MNFLKNRIDIKEVQSRERSNPSRWLEVTCAHGAHRPISGRTERMGLAMAAQWTWPADCALHLAEMCTNPQRPIPVHEKKIRLRSMLFDWELHGVTVSEARNPRFNRKGPMNE